MEELLRVDLCAEVKRADGPVALEIPAPDDFHLHLRDGPRLQSLLADVPMHFGRAIIMPNLKPPVTTTEMALAYRCVMRAPHMCGLCARARQ